MRIKFEGAEADTYRLEAYEGLKSIEGLVRVARITSHYAVTDEVRFRAPYTDQLEIQISQIRNGSFEMLFEYASRIVNNVNADIAKLKADQLFQFIVKRGTGQTEAEDISINGQKIPSGDIAAMSEASEAGLKSAHRWVNNNAKRISVIDGEDQVPLNIDTKNYVEEEIVGEEITRDVSVAAMNVNSKNGRVYLLDEHRTVPFIVHREATNRTISNLSKYLQKYANKTGETVNIRYRPVCHIDDRIKRLIIFDCYDIRGMA